MQCNAMQGSHASGQEEKTWAESEGGHSHGQWLHGGMG